MDGLDVDPRDRIAPNGSTPMGNAEPVLDRGDAGALASSPGEPTAEAGPDPKAQRRVVWFGLALLVVGAVTFVFGVLPLPPRPSHAFGLPDLGLIGWLLVTAGFFVTEWKYVHITVRRETHACSLGEIPLVAGLFLLSPAAVVLADVIGSGLSFVVVRKQHRQPVKLLINTASFIVSGSATVIAFSVLSQPQAVIGPRSWVAVVAATAVFFAVNIAATFSAFAILSQRIDFSTLRDELTIFSVVALTTASIATIGVTLMSMTPFAAALMAVPVAGAYLGVRAYSSERRQHEAYETLYLAQRILRETPEIGASIRGLLEQVRATFRSKIAEITLFTSEDQEALLRTVVESDGTMSDLAPVTDPEVERPLLALVQQGGSAIIQPGGTAAVDLHRYAMQRKLSNAMVVPLRGETRVVGALLVANRVGHVSAYRSDELHLLSNLATNAIPSLEQPEVDRTLAELHALKEELERQSYHDTLTGLANRAVLDARLAEPAARAMVADDVALLYLDIVEFRSINTLLGSDAGDRILIETAERLLRSTRPGDLVVRISADKFAVLIDHVAEPELPVNVAERIGATMRLPFDIDNRKINIRVSLGVAVSNSTTELLRQAEIAMEHAREDHRRRYVVYDDSMKATIGERMALREALAEAVREEQFIVHYQPIVDLQTAELRGFEALVRWDHPTRGFIPPNAFIPLAEDTGIIVAIGEQVLRRATTQLAEWHRARSDLVMSVNLSAREFASDGLIGTIEDALRDSGIPSDTLVLEMTERDLMDDTGATLERLAALKGLGVKLAIDDFGTGYSSLSYLQRFPVDILKIAKEFVDDISGAEGSGLLAQAIIDLGRTLQLEIVAEGIEAPVQRARLIEWGCPQGQGWLFAKAVSASEIDLRHPVAADNKRAGAG